MISLPQALAEGSTVFPIANGRGAGEESQHRHRWLLGARRETTTPLPRRRVRSAILAVRW
jgi:hypothetical protein